MAVEQIVGEHMRCLLDGLESVSVLLQARFKLEFQAALVFAVDRNRPLVLALIRGRLVRVDVSIRHTKVLGMVWISHAIRLEEKLEGAEVKFSNVLGLVELSDLEAKHGLLLWLVVKASQFELLLAPIVNIGCDLCRIQSLKRVVALRHRRRSVIEEEWVDSRGRHLSHESGRRSIACRGLVLLQLLMLHAHLRSFVQLVCTLDLVQYR